MSAQSFKFKLILSGIRELTPAMVDSLYESGCDDAVVFMRDGVAFADFCRDSESLTSAIQSALNDVRKAGFDPKIESSDDSTASMK